MKYHRHIITAMILLSVALASQAQDCVGYHEIGDCQMDLQRGYKIYSQSKSLAVSAKDTIDLNIVFYGQKDYIFSFCTHAKFYPVHYQLIDPETEDVLYDNSNDRYIESLGIGFDVTKTLTIRVNVMARRASEEEIEQYVGCLGLLIQYRNYPDRKVQLEM
jgi:hypothetical protein